MKKQLSIALLLCSYICSITTTPMLSLQHVKNNHGPLNTTFLKTVHDLFHCNIFVETGTFLGESTYNAIPFFNELHTIELSPMFYSESQKRFNQSPQVHVYLGDSTDILPSILPTLRGKVLFWLDGHYSAGTTAKGKLNTPIVQELLAIISSGIQDAVILIDDLRCFQHFDDTPINAPLQGYPSIKELEYLIKGINPEYKVYVYGDTLLAFLSSENVTVSPVIHACTISRMYEAGDFNIEEVLEAEKIIATAQDEERAVIESLNVSFSHRLDQHKIGSHYKLWQGLIHMHNNHINEAQQHILEACMLSNFQDQRMHYYLKNLGKRA